MKVAAFKYTDVNGKVTNRQLMVFSEPSDKYAGIDVSNTDNEDLVKFILEYEKAYDEYLSKLEELKAKYDLKHNYRQFLAKRIEDMVVESI